MRDGKQPSVDRQGETDTVRAPFGVSVLRHRCGAARGSRVTGTLQGTCLTLVNAGLGELDMDGERLALDPTRLLVSVGRTDYCVQHRCCEGGHTCAASLVFDERAWPSLTATISELLGPRRGPYSLNAGCATLMAHLRSIAVAENPRAERSDLVEAVAALVEAGTNDCLGKNRGSARQTTAHHRRIVARTREYLLGRFTQPLRLAEVARYVDVSKYHLCRLFKNETGLTLGDYVRRLRIHTAILRLHERQRDLSDLAVDLGYCSHSHFTAAFRAETGRLPSELRSTLSFQA